MEIDITDYVVLGREMGRTLKCNAHCTAAHKWDLLPEDLRLRAQQAFYRGAEEARAIQLAQEDAKV
jgi:hypothetical protein